MDAGPLPKIFVFCNTRDCHRGGGNWHSMVAIAEDGHALAGHICSSHRWAVHDMGIGGKMKHDIYAKHYPNGFEVVGVESDEIETHPGLQAAFKAAAALPRIPEEEGDTHV